MNPTPIDESLLELMWSLIPGGEGEIPVTGQLNELRHRDPTTLDLPLLKAAGSSLYSLSYFVDLQFVFAPPPVTQRLPIINLGSTAHSVE